MNNFQKVAAIAAVTILLGYAIVAASVVFTPTQKQELIMEDILAFPQAEAAHLSVFLKIDGIDGESRAEGHDKHIDVISWSFGVSQSGSPTMSSTGALAPSKPDLSEIVITKPMDKASPKLFEACANGKHIPEVTLTAFKAGEPEVQYLEVKMKSVFITSYQTGSAGDTVPTENVSFNYSQIIFTYTPQKLDGTSDVPVTGMYDLKKSKG